MKIIVHQNRAMCSTHIDFFNSVVGEFFEVIEVVGKDELEGYIS